MHALVFIGINVVFVYQANNPLIHTKDPSDVATVAVTFTILYFMLTYATYLLKAGYDRVHGALRTANVELQSKANEIEAQNEELMQAQDNLSTMNTELERLVVERTERLRKKTETLIRYSYSNAHHLRGPVARLMGLVAIRALDKSPDNDFFFAKVREQAEEIDKVVRQINTELGDL
jgi:signal transduction histidine kinase